MLAINIAITAIIVTGSFMLFVVMHLLIDSDAIAKPVTENTIIDLSMNYKDTPIKKAQLDYEYCLRKSYPFADYITINISSPNTENLRSLQDSTNLHALLNHICDTRDELKSTHGKYKPIAVSEVRYVQVNGASNKGAPDNSKWMVQGSNDDINWDDLSSVIEMYTSSNDVETAAALTTARTINGTSFDGSANKTIDLVDTTYQGGTGISIDTATNPDTINCASIPNTALQNSTISFASSVDIKRAGIAIILASLC